MGRPPFGIPSVTAVLVMDLRSAKKKAQNCGKKGHLDERLTHYEAVHNRFLCAVCLMEDDTTSGALPIAEAAQRERKAIKAQIQDVAAYSAVLSARQQQLVRAAPITGGCSVRWLAV